MKYTKDDFAKMGDERICSTIERLAKPSNHNWKFDYLSWDDIMPLAVEHKISLFAYQDAQLWCAQHYFDAIGMHTTINESPQRALACCLILVLQER